MGVSPRQPDMGLEVVRVKFGKLVFDKRIRVIR
jgi:hypothetical protein